MNSQDIFDGITDMREDLINEAKEAPKKRKRRIKKRWLGAVAAVLTLAVLGGVFLRPGGGLTAYAIAQAKYPKMAPYPSGLARFSDRARDAWREGVKAQQRDLGDISPLQSFFARSTQTLLTGTQGQNRVYSPLNLYMALSMLAQVTGGESREQILTLLGSGSMEVLRRQVSDVWNDSYRNDGIQTSILAASLWLNKDVRFHADTMDSLARDFYASSYRGEMGSKPFNKALQDWLNKQTGGLLKEQAGTIGLDSETILALRPPSISRPNGTASFPRRKPRPRPSGLPPGMWKPISCASGTTRPITGETNSPR